MVPTPTQRQPQTRFAKAWLLTGGLILVIGLIFQGVGLYHGILEIAFDTRGKTATGTVIDAWRDSGSPDDTNRLYLSYRFTPEGGAEVKGSRRVHWSVWERMQPGGPVAVQYLPGRPGFNRVMGQSEWSRIILMLGIGILLSGVGIRTIGPAWKQRRHEEWLRTQGTPAVGVITALTETPYRWNNQQLWAVRYRYPDRSGQEHEGAYDGLPAEKAQGLAVGGRCEVRYDPNQPEVSLWVGRN